MTGCVICFVAETRALTAAARERSARRRVWPKRHQVDRHWAITSCTPWASMKPLIASSTNPPVALKIWVAAGVGSCGRLRPASMTRSTALTNTDSASAPPGFDDALDRTDRHPPSPLGRRESNVDDGAGPASSQYRRNYDYHSYGAVQPRGLSRRRQTPKGHRSRCARDHSRT
jgi:hypothetical protein